MDPQQPDGKRRRQAASLTIRIPGHNAGSPLHSGRIGTSTGNGNDAPPRLHRTVSTDALAAISNDTTIERPPTPARRTEAWYSRRGPDLYHGRGQTLFTRVGGSRYLVRWRAGSARGLVGMPAYAGQRCEHGRDRNGAFRNVVSQLQELSDLSDPEAATIYSGMAGRARQGILRDEWFREDPCCIRCLEQCLRDGTKRHRRIVVRPLQRGGDIDPRRLHGMDATRDPTPRPGWVPPPPSDEGITLHCPVDDSDYHIESASTSLVQSGDDDETPGSPAAQDPRNHEV